MRHRTLSALTVAACLALVLPAPAHAQRGRQAVQLPDGAGRALVETACTECHRLNLIANSWGYTREGWTARFASIRPQARWWSTRCRPTPGLTA